MTDDEERAHCDQVLRRLAAYAEAGDLEAWDQAVELLMRERANAVHAWKAANDYDQLVASNARLGDELGKCQAKLVRLRQACLQEHFGDLTEPECPICDALRDEP